MQQSSNRAVSFVSSNRHKYAEADKILTEFGICTNHIRLELVEIQSSVLAGIAESKARDAFLRVGRPVLVEDDGLFVDRLQGFPGPYSSYVLETIGLDGILNLLHSSEGRDARFVAVVAYDDGRTHRTFEAAVRGAISQRPAGDGWGYDPIFIPNNYNLTFAQMGTSQKIRISHRTSALKMFASWYTTSVI